MCYLFIATNCVGHGISSFLHLLQSVLWPLSPQSLFAPRTALRLVAAASDLISFGHGVPTVPILLCDSCHSLLLPAWARELFLRRNCIPVVHCAEWQHKPYYIFHSVTTYMAYGIHTTFSLNLMPSPFIWTSSSHFKKDLISFWHSLLISLSISGKCSRIWISHVGVGKMDLWYFSAFSLYSKKL